MNTENKPKGFFKRIISDGHEFIITLCISVVFFGFLICTSAVLYKMLGDAKVDDSLIEFFKEYDDLIKMILTYIFTRWQMGKAQEKEITNAKP